MTACSGGGLLPLAPQEFLSDEPLMQESRYWNPTASGNRGDMPAGTVSINTTAPVATLMA
jgi:hypothetical protein